MRMDWKTEHTKFVPITAFGRAVSESNFSRVCIACGKQWSDRMKWVQDTVLTDTVMTSAGNCAIRVCPCGNGKMIAEGKSINGPKPGPTGRPKHLDEYDKIRAEARKRESLFKSKALRKADDNEKKL